MTVCQHCTRTQYLGWPNEGIDFWNGYWRRRSDEGLFDDLQEEQPCEDQP